MANVGVIITAKEQISAATRKAAASLRGLSSGTRKLARAFTKVRGAAGAAVGAIKSVASRAMGAAKILGGVLLGAVVGLVGVFSLLKNGLGAMRESVERVTEGSGGGGMAGAMDAAAESSEQMGSSVAATAAALDDAGRKIDITLGAFGAVGAGFTQRAGAALEDTKTMADKATAAAGAATKSLGDADSALGGTSVRLSDFGAALDRIAASFQGAKDKIMVAIAGALTPALLEFAGILEGPAFQKFVDMLANELAEAAEDVSDWLINTGIPAFEDFLEAVENSGGVLKFIEGQWREFKRKLNVILLGIAAIIILPIENIVRVWGKNWRDLKWIVSTSIQMLKDKFRELSERVNGIFMDIGDALANPFAHLEDIVNSVFEIIRGGLGRLPPWFLKIIGGFGGSDDGGGSGGDWEAQSARDPGGRNGTGAQINVYVNAPPGSNPRAFGAGVANGMLQELRRRGGRVPTLA